MKLKRAWWRFRPTSSQPFDRLLLIEVGERLTFAFGNATDVRRFTAVLPPIVRTFRAIQICWLAVDFKRIFSLRVTLRARSSGGCRTGHWTRGEPAIFLLFFVFFHIVRVRGFARVSSVVRFFVFANGRRNFCFDLCGFLDVDFIDALALRVLKVAL